MLSTVISFAGRILGAASWAAWLGPFAPIVTGVAKAIGGLIEAIVEIVVALSRSPEGRIVLALLVGAFGFLYFRAHYIEAGKAIAPTRVVTVTKPCARLPLEKRRR